MITTALLGLALIAPADTPTEPIDEATMGLLIVMDTPEMTAVCADYRFRSDSIVELAATLDTPEIVRPFTEFVDAYFVIGLEDDSLRLTPEARDVFVNWLHADCTP